MLFITFQYRVVGINNLYAIQRITSTTTQVYTRQTTGRSTRPQADDGHSRQSTRSQAVASIADRTASQQTI